MGELTAVAMSGGLDSSVAAWLLSRNGRPAVGLSMLLWDRSSENSHGRCCGALDLADARRVAGQCGIRHYTFKMDREFRDRVVDPFVDDYLAGRTPIPCTDCNTWIKFDLFLERARTLGAERMATGHYARILEGADGLELHTAVDRQKDQSYYLFELDQAQLAAASFPLGDKTKDEVRELARESGLAVAEKGESMEICFVADGVREFIEEQIAERPERFAAAAVGRPSRVVDSGGQLLGEAEPYYRYTVGQRRGLGIAASERLYVLEVRADENRLTVGSERELAARGLNGERLHWIGPPPADEIEATVRIRSRHPGVLAAIRPPARRDAGPGGGLLRRHAGAGRLLDRERTLRPLPRIEISTDIRAAAELCFDLARDLDLHQRSMAHTSERAVAGRTTGLIELGEQVTWRARHFGIVHEHTSRITAFDRPRHFRDEMTRGRFKSFVHDHYFDPIECGTRMRDVLEFASPMGVVGRLVDALLLDRYLTRLLKERNQVIRRAAELESDPVGANGR